MYMWNVVVSVTVVPVASYLSFVFYSLRPKKT
uniref:Uncharacterized protein n=1 Tax=Arundo donax TaxID=35708 RepID=A0A0A9H7R3_ARUDO